MVNVTGLSLIEQTSGCKRIDPAVARFGEKLDETEKREFVGKVQAFVRTYALLAQLIDFEDTDLEKLHAYGKFLLRKLPRTGGGRGLDQRNAAPTGLLVASFSLPVLYPGL